MGELTAIFLKRARRGPMDPVILERRVRQRIAEEKELLIDPKFFASLNEAIPEISSIRLLAYLKSSR